MVIADMAEGWEVSDESNFVYVNNIDRARGPAHAPNAYLVEGTNLSTSCLGFNLPKPPLMIPKVWQALALAMEADEQLEMTSRVWRGVKLSVLREARARLWSTSGFQATTPMFPEQSWPLSADLEQSRLSPPVAFVAAPAFVLSSNPSNPASMSS